MRKLSIRGRLRLVAPIGRAVLESLRKTGQTRIEKLSYCGRIWSASFHMNPAQNNMGRCNSKGGGPGVLQAGVTWDCSGPPWPLSALSVYPRDNLFSSRCQFWAQYMSKSMPSLCGASNIYLVSSYPFVSCISPLIDFTKSQPVVTTLQ